MSDREFTDITADVDALLADPSHAPAIASARESLAMADREWANVSSPGSAPTLDPHRVINPKVVGSNPTPANAEGPCERRAFGPACYSAVWRSRTRA